MRTSKRNWMVLEWGLVNHREGEKCDSIPKKYDSDQIIEAIHKRFGIV